MSESENTLYRRGQFEEIERYIHLPDDTCIVDRKVGLYALHYRSMPVNEIESPCISVCNVDREKGRCANCGRTRDQIVSWRHLEPTEREEIMEELEQAGYPKPDA